MGSGFDKSTRVKLVVIFGLFIGLLIGLIIYEALVHIKAKEQRKNFELLRKKEQDIINSKTGKMVESFEKDTNSSQTDSVSVELN
ncbi:MAG: hypothetical protein ACPGEG_03135 [Salibacteraceae bacterium]